MSPLPDLFISPMHLPFNGSCLQASFRPAPPDADPGGAGVWVVLRGTEMLVRPGAHGPALPQGDLPEEIAVASAPLYIGQWENRPCRVVSLEKDASVPATWLIENLLASDPILSIELLSLGGTAGQILHWEKNSRSCSRCAADMERLPGEWGKRCRGCGYLHYPHIHPCVIVLVQRGSELLLTRKAGWPPGRYGLVAGFLDFGECLEEAVSREVMEETGVQVRNIRYVGSQSWPFPSQLMAGFVAEYAGGEICVEEKELEDARWFPVDCLPFLPPKRSIARYLIDHYASAWKGSLSG